MPQQYGTNGTNSDGSCMNVGNQIWDPDAGGRPSIKLFPQYSSGAAMSDLLFGGDPSSESSPSQPASDPKAKPSEVKAREELKRIYRDYCPEKSEAEVESILLKFAGKEEELLPKVRAKYLPEGQHTDAQEAPSVPAASDRNVFSGSAMADLLGGGPANKPSPCAESAVTPPRNQPNKEASPKQVPKAMKAASNVPDEFVQAGLYRAAQEGNMKAMKLAVETDGADVNGRNEKDGYLTALHYVSRSGNVRMVEYLLQVRGIDKSVLDANGISAAEIAKCKDIGALLGRTDC